MMPTGYQVAALVARVEVSALRNYYYILGGHDLIFAGLLIVDQKTLHLERHEHFVPVRRSDHF